MGMLLRRYHNIDNSQVAGVTEQVAPKTVEVADVVEEQTPEVEDEISITRTEIMRMNVAEVRKFAKGQGIKDVEEKSGAELKRLLCDKLLSE